MIERAPVVVTVPLVSGRQAPAGEEGATRVGSGTHWQVPMSA